MSQIYLAIKHAHIGLVGLSGTLFAARGLGVIAGADWPMQPLARRLSVAIDVLLLAAGITLWILLGLHPLHHSWLGTKLALLLLYIVLGSFALKRAPTRGGKSAFLIAALALFCFMASVALAHHPAGWFARFSAA